METSTSTNASSTTSQQGKQDQEWRFLQCFGERAPDEDVQEADIISAVEFNHNGRHLATGDRGGRVVLFEQGEVQPKTVGMDERPSPRGSLAHLDYRYLTEFQSHDPEFDYLKSMEIEEKINQVKWVDRNSQSQFILSTNDKTVKLWRVYDRVTTEVASYNVASSTDDWTIPVYEPTVAGAHAKVTISPLKNADSGKWKELDSVTSTSTATPYLHLPQVRPKTSSPAARLSKMYANAHTYHINSVSMSSDQETFMSADDLRINLWNLEVTDCAFNILDLKPANMEDLAEVITCAEFHPQHCNIFAYSCSKGDIKMADMRAQALCDQHVKEFGALSDTGSQRSAYSEIIGSISDMRFCRDGRYMASRDYMTIKLWDINMESRPLAVFPVHEHLRSKFAELYENNGMFDKFNCCISGDGKQVASGTYGNMMKIFQQEGGSWPEKSETLLEASRDPSRRRHAFAPKTPSRFGLARNPIKRPSNLQNGSIDVESVDFNTKLLHLAWNPENNVLAAAAANSLYLYCQQ